MSDSPAPSNAELNLALFDFDGTITTKDTFTPFVYFATHWARIALGSVLLAPMILGYKLGLVSGTKMRAAVVRLGFRGRAHAEVLPFAYFAEPFFFFFLVELSRKRCSSAVTAIVP